MNMIDKKFIKDAESRFCYPKSLNDLTYTKKDISLPKLAIYMQKLIPQEDTLSCPEDSYYFRYRFADYLFTVEGINGLYYSTECYHLYLNDDILLAEHTETTRGHEPTIVVKNIIYPQYTNSIKYFCDYIKLVAEDHEHHIRKENEKKIDQHIKKRMCQTCCQTC